LLKSKNSAKNHQNGALHEENGPNGQYTFLTPHPLDAFGVSPCTSRPRCLRHLDFPHLRNPRYAPV